MDALSRTQGSSFASLSSLFLVLAEGNGAALRPEWENWSWWNYSALFLWALLNIEMGWAWFPGTAGPAARADICLKCWWSYWVMRAHSAHRLTSGGGSVMIPGDTLRNSLIRLLVQHLLIVHIRVALKKKNKVHFYFFREFPVGDVF